MRTFNPKRRYIGLYVPNCLAESDLFNWTQKALWGRLGQYCNDEGVAWPKIDTLARDLALSRRTIVRIINELDEVLLEVTRPDGIHRLSHRSNRYRFLYHEVFQQADVAGCQFVTPGGVESVTSGGVQTVTSTEQDVDTSKEHPTGEAPPTAPAREPAAAAASDRRYKYSPGDKSTAMAMYEVLHKAFPPDSPPKEPHIPLWANTIRFMRAEDRRTHGQIIALWHWVIHHDYWAGKILSPGGLRKRWDQLILEREKCRAKYPDTPFGVLDNRSFGSKYDRVETNRA